MRRALLVIALLLPLVGVGIYAAATRVLASDYARTTLEEQLTTRLGQPVHIGALSATIYPRVAVDLDNVTVGAPATVTWAHVRLVTGLRALFSRTISDAELIIRNSRLSLPLPLGLLSAVSGTNTTDTGPGLTIASVRVISLENVELVAPPHEMRIDLRGSLAGDRLDIERFAIRGRSSKVDGTGMISSLARVEGAIEATADPIDLDELMAIAAALTGTTSDTPQSRVPAAPMRLTIALKATRGQFDAYTFSDLSTSVALTSGTVTLTPFAVRAFGGQFKGRLDVDTRAAPSHLRLTGRVDGLDVGPLMKANGAGGITGTFGGTVTLSANGTDAATVLQTARGTIGAAITNGTIEHLDLVRTIVLAFGKPSGVPPQGSGSTFTRLGGTFALANRTLTSTDLSLASRDFDVSGRSTLRLSTGALDARGDVALSRELTSQAGTDLRRYAQQDGRVIVPAIVGGTIDHPEVTVDIQAAAARAFQNEIQRRAKSLFEGLLKKKGKRP
jgi:AsmA-like C-terminal region